MSARDLRAQLLSATGALIRKRGIGFVSLRAVARSARVSHGAPAHHFGNKAGLLTAFAAEGFRQMGREVVAELESLGVAADPRDQLAALGNGYVRFALRNPEQFGIMFRSELLERDDPGLVAASDAAHGLLLQTLGRCHAQGHLKDQSVEIAATAAWSLVHGLATLWLGGRLPLRLRERDPDRLARAVTRLFVRSLMP